MASSQAAQQPLLLLPGTLCDERVFARLRELLPAGEAVVASLTGAETTPDLAHKILNQVPPRFALAGFSLGGIVALEMVALAPHRISGLALIDTTARADPPSNAAVRRAAVKRAREAGTASYILDAWPTLVSPRNAGNTELQALLVDMAEGFGPDPLASQSEVAIHRADSRPRLNRIEVPTLVLYGEDERVCPPDVQEEMARLIPRARLARVSGAGHFALLEQPEAVARHIRTWLAAIPNPQQETTSEALAAGRMTDD